MAKEKQTRRMIAMALAAAVTMSSVPVVAFAEEGGNTPSVTSESDTDNNSENTTSESGDGTKEDPKLKVTVTVNGPDESNKTTTVTKTDTTWHEEPSESKTVDFDGEKVNTVVTVPKENTSDAPAPAEETSEGNETPAEPQNDVIREHETTDDTTTTVETTEDGTTKTVENVQTETGTREDGTIVDKEVTNTKVTETDAEGNLVEEYETEVGSERLEETVKEDAGDGDQPDVEVNLEIGKTTSQAVTSTTTTGDVPIFDWDTDYDYTVVEEVERTVTATTSEIKVTVNDSTTGLVGDEAGALKGLDPVYDEDDNAYIVNGVMKDKKDGEHVGKEDVFDRNYLSSKTLDYVNINGVSIWVDKGTKTIVDVVTPEGAELPEHDMLKDVTVGANVSYWYPKSNSFAKNSFPEGTVYKGGTKINNIDNWYDDDGNLLLTEEGDFRYVGTGEHSKFFNAYVFVEYEKDEAGNTVFDENGDPVIAAIKTSGGTTVTIDGVPATELPDEVSLEPIFDNYSGSRPTTFMLMDKDGNRVYAYCCDLVTGAIGGKWYDVSNLEDSDYYGSEESEEHIRSIVMNGYWGTSDVPDADGNYGTGSLEKIKQSLKDAINNGDMENETVQMPKVGEDGKPVVDEAGNPVMETKTMLELIDDMTEGEALLATQSAIWSYSNGSVNAMNGVDGPVVIDPDGYKWNHNPTSNSKDGEGMDDYGSARVDFLYKWLINLQTEEDSTVVVNEKNFVEDMSLVVGDKVEDHENNLDKNVDNDVYDTALNFKLAFVPGNDDDLLVQVTYTDMDGKDQTVVRRLAGENAEGQSYEGITPEEDGSYVISGLKLSENEDFNFDLRLEGTQYLEQGVYVYAPVGGRDVSQTFVGIAEGERNVDVSMGVTVSFDVDENDRVVATRKWSKDSRNHNDDGNGGGKDPVDPKDPADSKNPEETINIGEEETPLSDAPVVEGEEVMDIVDEEVPMAEVPLVAGAEEVSVIAQTGDSNHMAGAFGGMFAALAGMFFLRRKKED